MKVSSGSTTPTAPQSTETTQLAAQITTESTPEPQQPTIADLANANQMKADMALSGQMRSIQLASAEKDLKPVKENQPVDIRNMENRINLLRQCPQTNPVSDKAGNAPNLCGGAALTNALILDVKQKDPPITNARVIRDVARECTVNLSDDENKALQNFEQGKLSPNDTRHLQQVTYRIAQSSPHAAGDSWQGTGTSTTQIASTMTMLKAAGAFRDSAVTMHCNKLPNGGSDHWTCTVDRFHANSMTSRERAHVSGDPDWKKRDHNISLVNRGTPSVTTDKKDPSWTNQITLEPDSDEMKVQFRFPGSNKKPADTNNEYHEQTISWNRFDRMERAQDLVDTILRAEKRTLD